MTEKRFEYHHQNISFDRLIHCIFDKETQINYSEETLSDLKDFLNGVIEENSLFKEIVREMIRQTSVEIQPDNPTKYSGTFIFTAEQFMLLRKIIKDD